MAPMLLKWVATDDAAALAGASFAEADAVELVTVAVQKGHAASLAVILARCDVERSLLRDLVGIAILLGHVEVVKIIGDAAPGVLAEPDSDGMTTAYLAASVGNVAMLKVLSEVAPGVLRLPIPGGVTPIDVAWHRRHEGCLDLLRALGIPDPRERWEACCDGEPCGPEPLQDTDPVLS